MEPEISELDTIIYRGRHVEVGLFRCDPSRPDFEVAGPINNHLVVFPRTSVRIMQSGRDPVIAGPNVVMFYNAGQPYRRSRISEKGDHCEWFAFSPEVILSILNDYDPKIEEDPDRPFRFSHAPSDSRSYLLQRQVIDYLLRHEAPDHLFVEETLLWVMGQTVEMAYQLGRLRTPPEGDQREQVLAVQTLLSTRYRERLCLEQIAAEVSYSAYHLCRVFRQHTGLTIHQYLNQIRLRTALERVADGETNLTELALDLGYNSHSHFTLAFRKAFGSPPSHVREIPLFQQMQKMRKILTAEFAA